MFKIILSRVGSAVLRYKVEDHRVPYPPEHGANTRRKIVQSARALFNRYGFDRVSINQIMAGAGLTRGAFYAYFDGKSDLYADALGCFFTDPSWNGAWKGVHVDLAAADVGVQIIRAYLSRQHLDAREDACPMVALPTDVARAGLRAKRAYENVFDAMVDRLESGLNTNGRPRRATAQAIAALCVGSMIIARASSDAGAAADLCDASMAIALELGGWTRERNRSTRNHNVRGPAARARTTARSAR